MDFESYYGSRNKGIQARKDALSKKAGDLAEEASKKPETPKLEIEVGEDFLDDVLDDEVAPRLDNDPLPDFPEDADTYCDGETLVIENPATPVDPDREYKELYDLPEGQEPLAMEPEQVDAMVDQFEQRGFQEGVDFLVDEDGKFLCTDKMDKTALAAKGVRVGDLY